MAKKKMHVRMLLDETGSMLDCYDATISGFNEYIGDLKQDKKTNYMFSLTKFNSSHVTLVHDAVAVEEVPLLSKENYKPASTTPLYDAIAHVVNNTNERLKNVLVIIQSDGMENASKEYTRQDIFEMIGKCEKKRGWTFVYLGANQDAYHVGHQIGIQQGNIAQYDTAKTPQAFQSVSRSTVNLAAAGGVQTDSFFEDEDLKELE